MRTSSSGDSDYWALVEKTRGAPASEGLKLWQATARPRQTARAGAGGMRAPWSSSDPRRRPYRTTRLRSTSATTEPKKEPTARGWRALSARRRATGQ
jgi:hypothetical protein